MSDGTPLATSRRRGLLVVLSILISTFVATGLLSGMRKITDPTDPNFSREAFRIEDYHGPAQLRAALRHLLPKQSSQADVEALLAASAGVAPIADAAPPPATLGQYRMRYGYSLSGLSQTLYQRHYNIAVVYDRESHVTDITVNGTSVYEGD